MRLNEARGQVVPPGRYLVVLWDAWHIGDGYAEVELSVCNRPYNGLRISCDARAQSLLQAFGVRSGSELSSYIGGLYEIDVEERRQGVRRCSIVGQIDIEEPPPLKSQNNWQEIGF